MASSGIPPSAQQAQATDDGPVLQQDPAANEHRQEVASPVDGSGRSDATYPRRGPDVAIPRSGVPATKSEDGATHAKAGRQDDEASSDSACVSVQQEDDAVHCDRSEFVGPEAGILVSRSIVFKEETASAVRSEAHISSVARSARHWIERAIQTIAVCDGTEQTSQSRNDAYRMAGSATDV